MPFNLLAFSQIWRNPVASRYVKFQLGGGEGGEEFYTPFHFSFWKISFGLILSCEHPIQTFIKTQSVVSDVYDNFSVTKTKQNPPPLQPTNHLHENSKQNLRQNKMEGDFVSLLLRREVVRL